MSLKQERIINEQQLALQKAHRALSESQAAFARLREVASTAVRQIETGYEHCAADRLRAVLNEQVAGGSSGNR